MSLRNSEDVKALVAQKLGREPLPLAWELSSPLVEEVLNHFDTEPETLDDLIERIRSYEKAQLAGVTERPKRPERVTSPSARDWARSQIQALRAAKLAPVRRFRLEVLGGDLVEIGEIESWCERARAKNPQSGPVRFQVVLPSDGTTTFSTWIAREDRGDLGDLESVARELEREFGWYRSAAATFVLSGWVPPSGRISATLRHGEDGLEGEIIVRIADPSVTPDEVARFYAAQRRAYGYASTRPVQAITAELAVHIERARGHASWQTAFEAWMQEHPDTYRGLDPLRQFRRDARRAFIEVTGEQLPNGPLELAGEGEEPPALRAARDKGLTEADIEFLQARGELEGFVGF